MGGTRTIINSRFCCCRRTAKGEENDAEGAPHGDVQQDGLDDHGAGRGDRRAVSAVMRDQGEIEADIGRQCDGIERDAEVLLAGHHQQRFGRTDQGLGEDAGKQDRHQHIAGREGGAEERQQQMAGRKRPQARRASDGQKVQRARRWRLPPVACGRLRR